jgi:hypothetical protein
LIAYDTGKCYIEAVLFHPFTKIIGTSLWKMKN